MLAATRSGVMPVNRLRANASGTRLSLLHDVVGEPRVGARIEREGGQVVAVVVQDLADAIAHVALDGLAFAQHLPRHGVERVVVHPHEGAAQQVDAVEDETAGNRGLAAAEIAFGLAQAHRAGVAAEIEWMPHARGDSCKNRQVEVDDVPAGQYVRIAGSDAIAECGQRGELAFAADRLSPASRDRRSSTIRTSSTSGP